VKAVVWLDSLCATIGSSRSLRASSVVIGAQTMPGMADNERHLLRGAERGRDDQIALASRSSSSVTTTSSPLAKACRTSWINIGHFPGSRDVQSVLAGLTSYASVNTQGGTAATAYGGMVVRSGP
jgi:hypothetical protein